MPDVRPGNGAEHGISTETVTLRLHDRSAHAWIERLRLHASGPTVEAAVDDLKIRYQALVDFGARSGFATLPPAASAMSRSPRSWRALRNGAIVLVIAGLAAMQLSYALSTGISRGLGSTFTTEWRDGLVASVEQQILLLAKPGNEIPAEQRHRMLAAIKTLRARYEPFLNELTSAAGAPDCGARP